MCNDDVMTMSRTCLAVPATTSQLLFLFLQRMLNLVHMFLSTTAHLTKGTYLFVWLTALCEKHVKLYKMTVYIFVHVVPGPQHKRVTYVSAEDYCSHERDVVLQILLLLLLLIVGLGCF